jgi:hypothetical protein
MSEKPTNTNKKSINLTNITNKFKGMLTIDLMVEPKKSSFNKIVILRIIISYSVHIFSYALCHLI